MATTLGDLQAVATSFLAEHPVGGAFGLEGVLGAGKTAFVRACIHVLCAQQGSSTPRVTSPTYVLHQQYPVGPGVDHFDLYRLDKVDAVQTVEIGLAEAFDRQERGSYLFIEWPERLETDWPLKRIRIQIVGDSREISFP